jgi:hypothetical protein
MKGAGNIEYGNIEMGILKKPKSGELNFQYISISIFWELQEIPPYWFWGTKWRII